MAKIKSVVLNDSERAALEKGARDGTTFGYRQRCQIILLKAQNRTSKDVAEQVGCCQVVVNSWLKRYRTEEIDGLTLRKGRGRRAILHEATDLEAVRRVVQKNRQRVSLAKAELTQELNKEFSTLTLKRSLKKTVAATNECAG